MSDFFYWTGFVVWALVSAMLAWLVVWELVIVGGANSLSWHRWALKSPTSRFRWHKHGWRLLLSICAKTYEFWGFRNRGQYTTTHESGACWRGIGDWTAPTHPSPAPQEES